MILNLRVTRMKNKIVKMIMENQSFLILPHVKPDGDAIGSTMALAKGLRQLKKNVLIYSHDEIPFDVKFIEDETLFKNELLDFEYDVIFALDSSDLGRLKDRELLLNKPIINIDHHKTNTLYGHLNWVDPDASATGELIYELLKSLQIDFDKEVAQAIYVAIATDTGNFIYSNTTQKTHLIVADLMKANIDVPLISRYLYQNIPLNKFRFDSAVLNHVEFYHEGQLGIVLVSDALKTEFQCENTDNLVEAVRNIQGVEVAALIVERGDEVKISLRSKNHVDVAVIAQKNKGGGHKNAAGFSLPKDLDKAKALVIKEFENLV